MRSLPLSSDALTDENDPDLKPRAPISKPLCVKGVFLGAVVCSARAELVTRRLGDGSGVTEPKSR